MENLYKRATQSVFESNFRKGFTNPVSFLELERRGRQLSKEYSRSKFEEILKQGIAVSFLGLDFIAQIGEEQDLRGGILKMLSRLTAKTTSPKRSRKTVYRRNSTVIERSRQPTNWRYGSKAEDQKLLQRTVNFTPLDQWLKVQDQESLSFKKNEQERIASKKNGVVARNIKQWKELENGSLLNKKVSNSVLSTIIEISEKDGVRYIDNMRTRLINNFNKNIHQPVVFVWGPPYEEQGKKNNSFSKGQPEYKMLQDITNVLKNLEERGLQIKPILIYADLYGTKINGIPQVEVDKYFSEINKYSPNNFIITTISELIQQNNVRDFFSDDSAPNIEEIRAAKKIQLKLGRGISYQEAFKLASIYRASRLNEGKLLTEGFDLNGERIDDVIKLATAPNKEKDDPYEPNLPRFYVKKMTRASWNTPRIIK